MKRLFWRAVRTAYPNDTWYGHLWVTALYLGLIYAAYAMLMAWPWWKAVPMIGLQLALGWMSVPFLEMILPPVRNKETTHEKSTDGGDGTGAARRG